MWIIKDLISKIGLDKAKEINLNEIEKYFSNEDYYLDMMSIIDDLKEQDISLPSKDYKEGILSRSTHYATMG